jgi:integrase/recombinase XerD
MVDEPVDIPAHHPALASPPTPPVPPLSLNPAVAYLESLAPGSQRTMRAALNTIAGLLDVAERRGDLGQDVRFLDVCWGALRAEQTVSIQARLQAQYAPATASKLLAALRRVLREARRLGHLSAEDYEQAVDLSPIKALRRPRGRLVSDAEVAALLRVCIADTTPAGGRDAAILALLRGTGLRRAEAAALDLADYEPASGALTIRDLVAGRARVAHTPAGCRATLDAWLVVRGDAPGPLFYGVVKGGSLAPRRLAGQAMAVICASRAIEAGIALLTPHDLRRSFMRDHQ